ncbi:MAG: FxsA family protein [bacterium]
MSFIAKAFFGVLIYLFVEIYVFVEVSLRMGFFSAAALLIAFSIAGYIITKRIKGISLRNAIADYSEGKSPGKNLIKSAGFFISGVLFLMPGFITDFIAILFLIPFLNYYLVYLIIRYFKNKFDGSFRYQNQNTFTFMSFPLNKNNEK